MSHRRLVPGEGSSQSETPVLSFRLRHGSRTWVSLTEQLEQKGVVIELPNTKLWGLVRDGTPTTREEGVNRGSDWIGKGTKRMTSTVG